PAADGEIGFFGMRNVEARRRSYKAGYTALGYNPKKIGAIFMRPFKGTPAERVDDLLYEGTGNCGRNDGSILRALTLWGRICDEAKRLPGTREPQERFHNESFLQVIDRQFAAITQDLPSSRSGSHIVSNKCNVL